MANITWITKDGNKTIVDVEDGLNLMEAAVANDIPHIEGECGGCLSCATCHVFVESDWVEKTGSPDAMESSMLQLAEGVADNSRLSCQITVDDSLDGLTVRMPESQH